MKKVLIQKAFTLLEVLVALAIILTLTTLTMAGYNIFLEKARQKVCETNLQTLLMAVKMYVIRYDSFPASTADLELEDVGKAYAKVMKDRDLFTKFSHYFVKLNTPKRAYAHHADNVGDLMDPAKMSNFGIDPNVFICPSHKGVTAGVGSSYAINNDAGSKTWNEVMADADIAYILADGDGGTFTVAPGGGTVSGVTQRHFTIPGVLFAHTISKNGEIAIVDSSGNVSTND